MHILHGTETREFKEDLKSGIVKEVGKEFYDYYEIEKSNLSLYTEYNLYTKYFLCY